MGLAMLREQARGLTRDQRNAFINHRNLWCD